MRTGSGDRKIRGYDPPSGIRKDSPKPFRKDSDGIRSSDSGMGWDRGGDGLGGESWERRRAREFAFVRKNLPGEIPGLAVSALLSLRALGERPTRDSILTRLEDQGLSTRALREKGWIE